MVAFALSVVALAVVPQQPAARGQRLVEVTRAGASEYVASMRGTQNGQCPTRDGGLFVAVTRTRFHGFAASGGVNVVDSDLELWRSDDGGLTWCKATSMATTGDGDAAIVPDGDLLACAWTASEGKAGSSVFFQRFDPKAKAWLGAPVQLADGISSDDQYSCSDLARAADGSLVVAIGNNAQPRQPAWTCPWSTGMSWLPQGKGDWKPVQQVNVNFYGCCASLTSEGDLVHFTYRTNPGEAIHGLRTFDCKRGEFLQAREDNAGNEPTPDNLIANVGVFCADGAGGRTLLHLVGPHQPGKGALAVSYAANGGDATRTTRLAEDPPLHAGNENPVHYSLARGPGRQVFAYFSKQDEKFSKLWQCVVEEGQPIAPPKVVAEGDENAFLQVSGMRVGEVFCGLHMATLSRNEKAPGGVVSVFGSWPSRAVWTKARNG
jgi:hypothetical protein